MKTYTIKEVSQMTGISNHTLRFYEKEGVVPFVKRDESGNRIYDDENMEWLNFVVALRATGMPLSEIKQYVNWYKEGDSSLSERKQMMINHKAKIEQQMRELYKYLEQINYKLALYDVQEKALNQLP
ncbi:MerR family transcriptional regulator (plasmid) [Priestia megaterium]|uniref:MerR family transcriptional regulator n=1 Tax=Priestia megaterium TaxID=1404 RepID=UPI002ACE2845|nr:MerR family transcriptional regulator [Priestia megaterium]